MLINKLKIYFNFNILYFITSCCANFLFNYFDTNSVTDFCLIIKYTFNWIFNHMSNPNFD